MPAWHLILAQTNLNEKGCIASWGHRPQMVHIVLTCMLHARLCWTWSITVPDSAIANMHDSLNLCAWRASVQASPTGLW